MEGTGDLARERLEPPGEVAGRGGVEGVVSAWYRYGTGACWPEGGESAEATQRACTQHRVPLQRALVMGSPHMSSLQAWQGTWNLPLIRLLVEAHGVRVANSGVGGGDGGTAEAEGIGEAAEAPDSSELASRRPSSCKNWSGSNSSGLS